ncbi:MAG TPA: SDR family NAD(P)-dependent oxidoreductase [Jatrophihabitans sp.]|jgi:NAD(P)-dependent dehydrogenase (short-subunit alcohol dehydrogenase family)
MGALDGQVVVVTGGGGGLGREHALLLAAEGARVVVNDVGCAPDGAGNDPSRAAGVVEEIAAAGGSAVASTADVRTTAGAREVLALALDAFGPVDGLMANAGILRDRMFVNLSDEEWDEVIAGQLRATFTVARVFAAHWRDEHKAGRGAPASIVTVSSTSGLVGAPGQSNYGAAKAGIAAMSSILAEELSRYDIRVNCLVPVARTRMTADVPAFKELIAAPADPDAFDAYHPGNISPLVAWLLSRGCPFTGRTFYAKGGEIREMLPWHYGRTIDKGARWSVAELDKEMRSLA